MQGSHTNFSQMYPLLYDIMILGRLTIIGLLMFGLLFGSLYFIHFLYRLSRLSTDSRQYRQNSEFMVRENLIRYTITIVCILTLQFLLLYYFDQCDKAMCIGAGLWLGYLGFFYLRQKIRQLKKNQKFQL